MVSKVIVKSALHRRESRGAHYRLDFPEEDDGNWILHTLVELKNGQMDISTRPICFVK